MAPSITIVDYGVGNIGALINMFDYIGVEASDTSCPEKIADAEKLILPGVGSFDTAMSSLIERKLIEPLNHAVLERKSPVLGICLGMQLLGRKSEEGALDGLGWIEGEVKRIDPHGNPLLKIPHVGWSVTEPAAGAELFSSFTGPPRFYYVHSYHMVCDHERDVAANISYGSPICVAVSSGNIHGVQFHPEKSHRFGMSLLRTFAEMCA